MSKPAVLFVDDEPNLLNGLRRYTRRKRNDWEILFAGGGEEALKLAQSRTVDVLVADMRMPGLDGAALTSRVAAEKPSTILIILSGEAEFEQTYLAIGSSHRFVAKPCEPDRLVASIERTLFWQNEAREKGALADGSIFTTLGSPKASFAEMRKLLGAGDRNIQAIAAHIAQDPNLALRVLQLVNSAYFGRAVETLSIGRATEILGADHLSGLIELSRLGGETEIPAGEQAGRFTSIAAQARDHAKSLGFTGDDLDLVYAAGLFSRLGAIPGDGCGAAPAFIASLFGLPDRLSTLLADHSPSPDQSPEARARQICDLAFGERAAVA